MPKLTNRNRKNPVNLPGVQRLKSGESCTVTAAQLKTLRENPIVDHWIKTGILALGENDILPPPSAAPKDLLAPDEIEEDEVTDEANDDEANEAEQKDALIAELAKYNVDKDRRSSVDTLRALLDKAKEKAARKAARR